MVVLSLESQDSPLCHFQVKILKRHTNPGCWTHTLNKIYQGPYSWMRLIVSDIKRTGKPRIDHPRCRGQQEWLFVLWSLRKWPITCTQVCKPMLVRSTWKGGALGRSRDCRGTSRSLVALSSIPCTTASVWEFVIFCQNIHPQEKNE